MAFSQGYKQQVVNIGMDIVRIPDHVDNEEAETLIREFDAQGTRISCC